VAIAASGFEPYARSLLRGIAGFTFSAHGWMKDATIFSWLSGHSSALHLTPLLVVAAVLETVGGALMLVGLFTRPVAFILCGEMAVAYFTVHYWRARLPIHNGGELAVLYCFIFFYLIFAGAGSISLDALLRRRKV